jgi:hypothetical protein
VKPTGPPLSGVDGKDIPCWGHIRRGLTFGLRTFFITFLLAAIYRPILGLDFLSAHGLLVEPVGRQVLDSKTLKPLSKSKTAATGGPRSKLITALCSIAPTVRSLPRSAMGKESHRRNTRFATPSRRCGLPCVRQSPPLRSRQAAPGGSRIPPAEAAGIIRRSDLPWSSPLHMVCKKDGSWQPCGDYRRLNLAMTHDPYLCPTPYPASSTVQQAARLQILLLH